MNEPKISIITPSYNQAEYLEKTIKSVLDQNYSNLEYIIIDGASDDNSCDIIKKCKNRLHYWISEEDEGHGHALNKGFDRSTGEIMAWINSSDKYVPWTFQVVADIFEAYPHIEWITGRPTLWNSDGLMVSSGSADITKNMYDFLLGDYEWIQQESVFWRRSLWEKSGGQINPSYELMVDGELWTRFFLHADLYAVHTVLCGYRLHEDARSARYKDKCHKEMEQAIADMLNNASSDVQDCYHHFKKTKEYIEICEQSPFLKGIPVEKICRRILYPQSFEQVDYPFIYYDDLRQKWNLKSYPFTLDKNLPILI